jgi:hypothetical protein
MYDFVAFTWLLRRFLADTLAHRCSMEALRTTSGQSDGVRTEKALTLLPNARFTRLILEQVYTTEPKLVSNNILQERTLHENWGVLQSDGLVTSLEADISDTLLSVVTTAKMFWFDRRKMSAPLFSMKHHRMAERSLRGHTLSLDSGELNARYLLHLLIPHLQTS